MSTKLPYADGSKPVKFHVHTTVFINIHHIYIYIYIYMFIYIMFGSLEHVLFSPIVGMMIQSDQYFSGGLKPPTSMYIYIYIHISIWEKNHL